MSSGTEQRPHTTGPTPMADDTTVAMPRPTGPWPPQPSPFVPPAAAWAPAPVWSMPPARLGPMAPVPPRSGMRWGWIVLAIVAAIAAVVLVGTVAANNRTMTVNGSVAVGGWSYMTPGSGCTMTSAQGMPVTLYDATGKVVGTATLGTSGIARNTWNTSSYGYADSCAFSFTMNDVDASHDYYLLKSGNAGGDRVSFSRSQLETSGAHVTYR